MTWLGPRVTDEKTFEVTGELTPDATGTYEDAGEYNGKRSYELTGNGWFIWWNGIDKWVISTERGVATGNWWARVDPNIEGLYTPQDTALGDATVTQI